MAFSNRHLFRQKLGGMKAEDFYKNLDYKVNDVESRMNNVEKLLNNDNNFFQEYFDDYFHEGLNQDDALSTENTVCKTLETMANYILNSEDVRKQNKQSNKEYEYKFYKDSSKFRSKMAREINLEGAANSFNDDGGIIIDYLLSNNNNIKKSKAQIINNCDIKEDSYCGDVLREYQKSIDYISDELTKIRLSSPNAMKGKRYLLTKAKKDINDDMINAKNSLKGMFGDKLRNQILDSTVPDWSKFDWKNDKHIKELLFIRREFDIKNDVSFLAMDLDIIIDNLIRQGKFSPVELNVLELIKGEFKMSEIAIELGCSKMNISHTVKRIVKKICTYTNRF